MLSFTFLFGASTPFLICFWSDGCLRVTLSNWACAPGSLQPGWVTLGFMLTNLVGALGSLFSGWKSPLMGA